jgi:pimeloyl-ACP methyl ester carboxylesterase
MRKQGTVLFVHGWQGDRTVWDGVAAALGYGVRAFALDLPGFGDARDVAGPYTLERFSAELRGRIASLQTDPVVVVGHSMGAKVALQLAIDAPELVRALVLIAPVPVGLAGFSDSGQDRLRATAGDRDRVRAWLSKTIEAPPDDAVLDRLCAVAAKARKDAVLESLESWMHTDLTEGARRVSAPSLVIAPEHDEPDKAKTRVADVIPGARYAVLANAAHYCILEKPAEVAGAIREFIGGRNCEE